MSTCPVFRLGTVLLLMTPRLQGVIIPQLDLCIEVGGIWLKTEVNRLQQGSRNMRR